MCPENTELEGNPYPAVEIETPDKLQIVEIQVPAFRKRSTGHTQLPKAKMPGSRSAGGRCQRLIVHVLFFSDVHICSFGPFTPEWRAAGRAEQDRERGDDLGHRQRDENKPANHYVRERPELIP